MASGGVLGSSVISAGTASPRESAVHLTAGYVSVRWKSHWASGRKTQQGVQVKSIGTHVLFDSFYI